MTRPSIGDRAMTAAERQRRSRAQRGKLPNATLIVTEEEVIECARRAGPKALDALWQRECNRAIDALGVLDELFKLGHVTKYAKGKIDHATIAAQINKAWHAVGDMQGRVVFGDDK